MLGDQVEPGHLDIGRAENILRLLPGEAPAVHPVDSLAPRREFSRYGYEVRVYWDLAVAVVELDRYMGRSCGLCSRLVDES